MRCGSDDVSKANINLDRDSRSIEQAQKRDSNAFVILILSDPLRFHGRGIEDQSIVFDRNGANVMEDGFQTAGIVVALAEKVRVARWAVDLFCPQLEEQCTFEYEDRFVFGLGEPIK